MKHEGTLNGLSDELGKRARTNSEQLISIARPHDEWKHDPERIHISPGSVAITSGVWGDDQTSIEPVFYGVGSDLMAFALTYHQDGEQKHPVQGWLDTLVHHPSKVLDKLDARHWSERQLVLLAMQTSDTSIDVFWKDGILRSRHGSGQTPQAHIPAVEAFADRLAKKMHGEQAALWTEVLNRTASAHFIGERADQGVVDPFQRVFGYPGLHVIDGRVMPANPGVNPSLMITAMAERAMSHWPNNGDADTRAPLGSGYQRVQPVMPHKPIVPKGAPGELRLDATKEQVIPLYPY
jgi:cholesterol oxidase